MLNISFVTVGWAILVIILVLSLMLVYLLLRKKLEINKNHHIQSLKEKIQPELYKELFKGENSSLATFEKEPYFQLALIIILEDIQQMFDPDNFEDRLSKLADRYLKTHIEQLLDSNRWSHRMNALYMIKEFDMFSLLGKLWQRYDLERTTPQEKNVILQIAAKKGDTKAFSILSKNPPYSSLFFYKQMVRQFATKGLDQFITAFDELDKPFQVAILSYIAEKRFMQYSNFIEKCLQSADSEIRINALKAIRDIGYIQKPELLNAFLKSEDWVEQMLYAQTVGVLADKRYQDSLVQLIASPHWRVRYHAGEALTQLQRGIDILKEISSQHEDPFARDMADQWLGSV